MGGPNVSEHLVPPRPVGPADYKHACLRLRLLQPLAPGRAGEV